jgi:hypothetical protein
MASALRLRSALRRGALITAANWPLVVVQFVATALYNLVLAVPIVGGTFVVWAIVGRDMGTLLAKGVRQAAIGVFESLTGAPIALAGFLVALGIVAALGAVLTFIAKAGIVDRLAAGERSAGDAHRVPVRASTFVRLRTTRLDSYMAGVRRLAPRFLRLGAALIAAYSAIGIVFIGLVGATYRVSNGTAWSSAWPLIVFVATSAAVASVALVNLAYDLLQVILAFEPCSLREAVARMHAFVRHDARQVMSIFGVVLVLEILAVAISLVGTAGLELVAWVPFAGVLMLPMWAAGWLVRGLVFEYVGLTALAAYLSQYRRFVEPDEDDGLMSAWPRDRAESRG